jgi:hypothetical protein
MCKTVDRVDKRRDQFNFIEVVRSEFSWLTKYGFRCTKASATFVRYESATTFLNIYHGRSSYEIGAEYGQLLFSDDFKAYSVSELIRLSSPKEAEKYRNYIAIKPENVVAGVNRLSELLRKYGRTFLNDTPETFLRLAKQRNEISRKFSMEVLSRQVRPKANQEFKNKNYAEAARLFESIKSELSAAELKKLEFCRKNL